MAATPKFLDALAVLARHEVELIVVGGVAAVLNGAPISTFDLDILYRMSGENLARLTAALAETDAVYRDPAGRRIVPDASRLGAVIETKEQAGRSKDRATLDVLRATLRLKDGG